MSYTKMNVEITKYLKANNLPVTGTSTDSKEETEYRISSYYKGVDVVFKKWIEEKKYKELISCAHGGWFNAEHFLVPLAGHFADEGDLPHLRLLCERKIRVNLEELMRSITSGKENMPSGYRMEDLFEDVLLFAEGKKKTKDFENGYYAYSVETIVKLQGRALRKLDRYIDFLKQMETDRYLQMVEEVRDKTARLQLRRSDLKDLKFKG